jgi:hypothetical protein
MIFMRISRQQHSREVDFYDNNRRVLPEHDVVLCSDDHHIIIILFFIICQDQPRKGTKEIAL